MTASCRGAAIPDEDRRDGFEYGGWAVPYMDEVAARVAVESMAAAEGALRGRRTYEVNKGYRYL